MRRSIIEIIFGIIWIIMSILLLIATISLICFFIQSTIHEIKRIKKE